ncbi:MAG: M24 family metallopeptidase [Spirochaetota bacterium]
MIHERIKKVFDHIRNHVCPDDPPEAVLLINEGFKSSNFNYVTGLVQGVFDNCGVLFENGGRIYIFTTTLEEELLREIGGGAELEYIVYRTREQRNGRLKEVLEGYSLVGLCYESIPCTLYLALREMVPETAFVDVSRAFKMARMIKLPDEIDSIGVACRIVSEVADEVPELLTEGMTELDLVAEIDYRVMKKGAERPAFKTIVSFSANTSKPHYEGGNLHLKKNDVILVDFGAVYRGYVSDITRTFFTGNPSAEIVKLYSVVRKAQEIAMGLIGSGINVGEVEEEVRRYVDSHEQYRDRFIHSLGHSLGLDVHDDSYPGEDFKKRFSENMVLTVEPGIYIPGFCGVRIEDDILVESNSCRVLTTARK